MHFRSLAISAILLSCWNQDLLLVDGFLPSSASFHTSTRTVPQRSLISTVPKRESKSYMAAGDRNDSTSVKKNQGKAPYKGNKGKHRKPFNNGLGQAKAINQELINASTSQEVLDIFISKGGAKGTAGGDTFNSVNFSTCLHRLARFANQYDNFNQRNQNQKGGNRNSNVKPLTVDEKRIITLSDPRTAILIASLSEAIVEPTSNKALVFNNREFANLGWAIAKLKIAPPSNVYPIVRPIELINESKKSEGQNDGPEIISSTMEDMREDILATAAKVRTQVLEVARERSVMKTAAERATVKNKWIPTLSQLSGKLLDMIATQVLEMLDEFNSQELANLLYAFASSGRADHILFENLSEHLVKSMEDKSKLVSNDLRSRPKPQEFR